MGWKSAGQQLVYKLMNPVINLLVSVGIKPNTITLFGLFVNILASGIFIYGAERLDRDSHGVVGVAGAVILFAGLMDMVDGRLARVGKSESKYGAFYDSVMDRYSELFMFLGICYYLIAHKFFLSSLFTFVAMIGSVMVSYTRARAEGLGIKMTDVGLMQRPERILLIGISAILCGLLSVFYDAPLYWKVDWLKFPLFDKISIFTFPLFLLAILTNITAVNRIIYVKKQLGQ